MQIISVSQETDLIRSYDLRPLNGEEAPQFTAGAHVDVILPNGMIRSYSLMNSQTERHRYLIGVAKDRDSRGGSQFIHDHLCAGDILKVRPPRNLFPLDENAPFSVLIAGGIGVTPMISMARQLFDLNHSWTMYYAARTKADAAFLKQLSAYGDRVVFHSDKEEGRLLDIKKAIENAPNGAHFYCCGPTPMVKAFQDAVSEIQPDRIHIERFSPSHTVGEPEGGFEVVLAKSGRTVFIPKGLSILDVLKENGLNPLYSCQQGVCGACETKVLEGVPDHRDEILTADEKAANKTMMICCSGSKTPKLVLDL